MDIGVLGGTFDPIHLGHLMMAEEARQRLGLARVIFGPAGQPWLKVDRAIAAAADRVEMVRRAIAGQTDFGLSTAEVDRPGPSYTVDTVDVLERQLGTEASFFLLLGWDSLAELPLWKEPAKLVQRCRLVAIPRPDCSPPELEALESSIPGIARSMLFLDVPPVDISSSDIRERVGQGLPFRHLVPEEVAKYIEEQGLYRQGERKC